MGNAVMTALEKATVDGLLKVASSTGRKINRQDLVDLLFWCRRRGLLETSGQLFDLAAWQKIGKELWESVQTGAKGSKQLAKTYREVRLMIEQVHADAEVAKALQSAIAGEPEGEELDQGNEETLERAEEEEERGKGYMDSDDWGNFSKYDPLPPLIDVPPPPPIVAPAGFRGAFDDIIPPWNPEPPKEPSAPPMPMETEISPQNVPLPEDSESPNLEKLLQAQRNVMGKLLEEMRQIDGGADKPTRQLAYQRAADAIKQGLENIEKQIGQDNLGDGATPTDHSSPQPKELTKAQRLNLIDLAGEGEMGVEELNDYLRNKYGAGQGLTHSERRRIAEMRTRLREVGKDPDARDRAYKVYNGPEVTGIKEQRRKGPEIPRTIDPPRDPNFDAAKRWRRVVTNAEIKGDFTFTPLLAAPVVARPNGPEWTPLDWHVINKIQQAVLSYGIDNPLVKKQVSAFCKYVELVPSDVRMIMELILGPTSFSLFLVKWQERLEEKQLDNVHLADGDPLRLATLDQLMGTGLYRDPQREAALPTRVLAQSKAAALEAFMALPQIGKFNPPYLKIMQGEKEPFLSFVDKVKEAVEAAPNVPSEMKDVMVKEVVSQNANSACKRLLATLQPGATIVQMVEVCARAPWEEERAKARIQASALAVALKQQQPQGRGDRGPGRAGCCVENQDILRKTARRSSGGRQEGRLELLVAHVRDVTSLVTRLKSVDPASEGTALLWEIRETHPAASRARQTNTRPKTIFAAWLSLRAACRHKRKRRSRSGPGNNSNS